MKIKGKLTFLIDGRGATIEIFDEKSSTTFVKVVLTPEQLTSAMGRLAYADCKSVEVFGLDRIGKSMEVSQLEFPLPDDMDMYSYDEGKKYLAKVADKILKEQNEGWESDGYFSSQNTFFEKEGVKMVRVTIRRWV